jgi:anti-sigma B factor antagonist
MTDLNADLAVDGNLTVVRLIGDLDMASAPNVLTLATAALDRPGIAALLLDMAGVEFMDSSGIGAMVQTYNLCADHAVDLQLHGVTPRVRSVLDITGLTDWFGVTGNDAASG